MKDIIFVWRGARTLEKEGGRGREKIGKNIRKLRKLKFPSDQLWEVEGTRSSQGWVPASSQMGGGDEINLHKSGNELSLDLHKSGNELSIDLHKSGNEFFLDLHKVW